MRRTFALPALLVVMLLVSLAPLPVLAEDGDADGDYQQVVDITYPTDPRARYMDDYDTSRSGGRVHSATDLIGEKLWPVYAAVGGTVTFIPGVAPGESKPHYGYMIRITGDDDRVYSYVHLNDDTPGTSDANAGPEYAYAPGLERGSRVERGEFIGWMGDSGNAKGIVPHLHFVIADPAVTDPYGQGIINPYNSLKAAEARDDYADPSSNPSPAASSSTVDRVSGSTRILTAIALSQEGFATADTVVIASGVSFTDAIVAGPLAAALDAPLLTTFGTALEAEVIDEVNRLGATEAIVVGPRERVSTAVERDLINGTDVTPSGLSRIGGASDADTAARVAVEVRALTGSTDALVALGSHPEGEGRAWPDALAAGYHGAVTGQPILLVDHGRVPDVTLAALEGVRTATLVGGTGAISADHAQAIDLVAITVRRLSGQDRFATSAAVADDLLEDGRVDASRLWVATGSNYADAVAAASTLAAAGELFVLIDGRDRGGDGVLADWFTAHAADIDTGRAIGGSGVVTDAALARLAQRIR